MDDQRDTTTGARQNDNTIVGDAPQGVDSGSVANTNQLLPIPTQGLGEATHGNIEDASGIFYGDVGVDREIDATYTGAYSEGHHPILNPLPVTSANDQTYVDDDDLTVTRSAASDTASELAVREQGAQVGDARYNLTPNTPSDAPEDLESEGRTGTPGMGTAQDSFYGQGQHEQVVGHTAAGPVSNLNAPNTTAALGSFAMPGSQQIGGLQMERTQPSAGGANMGRPSTGGPIHVRGGSDEGYAYLNPDDHNPTPTENIAASVGERYITSNIRSGSNTISTRVGTANVGALLVALRGIGIQDDEMQVVEEGDGATVNVVVDKLNQPYVEQAFAQFK